MMLPVPEGFKRRLLTELSSRIPEQASVLPTAPADGFGGRARRRTAGWLAGGLGLTAVMAVAVIASVMPLPTRSGPPARGRLSSAAQLSGRQILLAAAATAQGRSVASGTYWYVETQGVATGLHGVLTDVAQIWTRRDGMQWQSYEPCVITKVGQARFEVAGAGLTFAQLQDLPANPAALKAWVIGATRRSDRGNPARQQDLYALSDGLLDLLYFVPAPPAVRAAAFRAMASFPDVTSLGRVEGGQGLAISYGAGEQERVVIDPATSMVRSDIAGASVKGKWVSKGVRVLAAGWTDHLPQSGCAATGTPARHRLVPRVRLHRGT
jgi:hypothetical protein